MTQVAAETLGLPIERVRFSLGDTGLPRAPVHGGSLTMASVGSAVQEVCRKAREDALAGAGANDLAEAMRRLGRPVEVTVDTEPSDASQRFSMHAFGTVFVEVACGSRISGRPAYAALSAPMALAALSIPRPRVASASAG